MKVNKPFREQHEAIYSKDDVRRMLKAILDACPCYVVEQGGGGGEEINPIGEWVKEQDLHNAVCKVWNTVRTHKKDSL